MLIAVLLLTGYAINLSHEATIISLPFVGNGKISKNTITPGNKTEIPNDLLLSGYVKLQPGTKIYFYTTEDENLMIGPKLQSEEDVSILTLNQDDDLKKFSQFKNSLIKPETYSVLKSGVLVPKKRDDRVEFNFEECNKCVYQSLKPTYYVRGFKQILIPVDVLYTKSKQEKLFKSLDSRFVLEPDSWRTDLRVSRLNQSHSDDYPEDNSEEIVDNRTKISVWSPVKNAKEHSSPNSIQPSSEKISLVQKRKSEFPVDLDDDVSPDTTCDGEVTLFVLNNDGVFKRMPSDPFLPVGMQLSYSLLDDLMFKPKFLEDSDLILSYITGKNGDLIPHSKNVHKVVAEDGKSVSFMLSKDGGMFPVKEVENENKSISYYYNGNLVHRSQQFTEMFSNSTSVLVNDKKFQIFENVGNEEKVKPMKRKKAKKNVTKRHNVRKRDTYFSGYDRGGGGPMGGNVAMMEPPGMMRQPPPVAVGRPMEFPPPGPPRFSGQIPRQPQMVMEPAINPPPDRRPTEIIPRMPPKVPFAANPQVAPGIREGIYPPESMEPEIEQAPVDQTWENAPLRPRSDLFTFDERGKRIRLIPEITENNDVVIYKLTCKGNLVRYPPCKEPEFGFSIHFQLLLDEFILVPTTSENKPYHLTYVLQENGDLVPSEENFNTFRKAPGSLIYYMLGKNNVLFPVQQIIDMEGNVSFFYQDFFLLKMKDSTEKPLHFTTKGAPLFAFFNGFTMITISSKPRLNPLRGSNWTTLKVSNSADGPPKTIYLTGPNKEVIKITPYKNKQGATVVYELDCNGIFYRSPKDKKKCIILRSYVLLKEGILLPSNDTSGYVYMMSKNGDLFPYLYPDGKIEAPLASSLKYVLCEKGILVPIKLEIIDNYICYIFKDVIIYKERVYCKSCLDRLDEEQLESSAKRKSSCDLYTKETDKARQIKLFVNKDGDYVFYEKENKMLKRYPPEAVPAYLKYTMGSFEVKPDGSLFQIRYQDPSENVANLMLEPNGDLLEDTRNVNKVRSQYYVLDAKGNLIAVEVKKTKKNLYFYKNGVRVCRVPIPEVEKPKNEEIAEGRKKVLPLNKDPLGLMDDPYPPKSETSDSADGRSLYIPIPLKSVSIADPPETCVECADAEHKKKCQMLKDTLKQVSKNGALPLALELELTDEIIEELKNWAAKCDKVLTRREIADDLSKYMKNLLRG